MPWHSCGLMLQLIQQLGYRRGEYVEHRAQVLGVIEGDLAAGQQLCAVHNGNGGVAAAQVDRDCRFVPCRSIRPRIFASSEKQY